MTFFHFDFGNGSFRRNKPVTTWWCDGADGKRLNTITDAEVQRIVANFHGIGSKNWCDRSRFAVQCSMKQRQPINKILMINMTINPGRLEIPRSRRISPTECQ